MEATLYGTWLTKNVRLWAEGGEFLFQNKVVVSGMVSA